MRIINKTIAMRIHFILGGLLCLMALSCSTNRFELEPEPATGPVELSFQAVFGDNQDSRTVLQDDKTSVWWSPRDSVKIFFGDLSSGMFVGTNTEPARTTVFTGYLDIATGTIEDGDSSADFMAVYPYKLAWRRSGNAVEVVLPDEQMAAENTFAPGMFPSVAQSSNMSLCFYNVCGGIVFTLTEEGIKTVTLKGNNGEPVAGISRVSFSSGYPVASTSMGSSEITLTAPDGGTFTPGVRYFISVYPQTFEQGFSLSFTKASSRAEVSWTKPATINRSRFLVIENADAKAGEYEDFLPEEAYSDLMAMYNNFMTKIASQAGASLYAPFRMLFNYGSDDVYGGGAQYGDIEELGSLNEYRFDADNAVVRYAYNNLYGFIRLVNPVIEKYQDDQPAVAAQARVLRAFAHMMLAIGWGTPPLEDHVLAEDELPANNVLTQKQILEWCVQECEASLPDLDARQSQQDKDGAYKVTRGFARAVAGKASLFAGDYQKARELLGMVIASGKYALVPGDRYWENFHIEGDGNEEKVFEPDFHYDDAVSMWGGAVQRSTWMESNLLIWRSDRFVQIPHFGYTGNNITGWGNMGVPNAFAEAFLANDGKDSYRLNTTIIHIDDVVGGSMYAPGVLEGWTKEQKLASTEVGILPNGIYGQSFWLPFKQMLKFEDSASGYGNTIRLNNFTIMRYAEVLLLYAEACLMTGDSAAALDVINRIQRRAGSQTISTTATLDVLKQEKQFELWFEGSRWADLVRWGDTAGVEQAGQCIPHLYDKFSRSPEATDENVIWQNGSEENSRFYIVSTHGARDNGIATGFVPGKHNLFPYPTDALAANPNLVQNPGW